MRDEIPGIGESQTSIAVASGPNTSPARRRATPDQTSAIAAPNAIDTDQPRAPVNAIVAKMIRSVTNVIPAADNPAMIRYSIEPRVGRSATNRSSAARPKTTPCEIAELTTPNAIACDVSGISPAYPRRHGTSTVCSSQVAKPATRQAQNDRASSEGRGAHDTAVAR